MSQQGVFGDRFWDLPWKHFGWWCRCGSRSGGSRLSIGGDEDGPPRGTRGPGFFGGGDPRGRMVAMRGVGLAMVMVGVFGCCPAAWGQISLVQVTSCGPSTFPGSCTIPATGSGHLIVVGWQSYAGSNPAGTFTSMTDNAGNVYVEAGAARSVDSAEADWNDIWYAKNSAAGATSVVITPNASSTGAVVIWEFSGVDGNAPLDQTATLNSQAASATPSGAAVTISAPNEVIISLVDEANSLTGIVSGNPFVNDSNLFTNGWAHNITSSTGTYVAQWNQSPAGTYGSSTASFKQAASYSACDLNQDGTVNILDVQVGTDMALGNTPCAAQYGPCNTALAQAVLTNAMGGACALPELGAAPSSISFGNITVGNSSTQTITLTGGGTSSTTISQATVSGAGFSISGPSLPLTVPLGQTANFSVTFTPTGAGSPSGSIGFVSSALNTPASVALSGTGVLPVLGVTPSSISFGNVTVGSSATQTITLTGTGTVTISQATVTGTGFSVSGPSLPLILAVGNTANFTVKFAPAAAGSVSGNIAFVSNASNTPANVTLSGTGVTAGSHSVSLTWTPSPTSDVASYNIYRITSSSTTAPATPYPSLASVLATTCSGTQCAYTDTSVTAGTSYWYYAAAVDTSNNVSAPSNIVQAVVPSP